mgnify:FL=1
MNDKKHKLLFLIIASLLICGLASTGSYAQSSEGDATVDTIESIGRDLVKLLDDLVFGERDPTVKLDILPVIEKVNAAAAKTPIFLEAKTNIRFLENRKNELLASYEPQISANGSFGQRTFQSTTSSGDQTRTTGQFVKPGITANQMLYDFKATENKIFSTNLEISATKSQIDATKSQIFLEVISAFYEVQRNLLQSRLARENLQSRKTFVNFIRERNLLGASSAADVVRAESRVAGALNLLAGSLQDLKRSQATYRQYFNEEAEPYVLPKELSVESLSEFELEGYITNHPEISGARLEVESAKLDLEAVRSENKGRLSVKGDLSYSKSPGSANFNDDFSFGLEFSRDLYTGGVEELKEEKAELAVFQSELNLDKLKIRLAKDIREGFASYEGAVSRVDAQMLVLNGAKESYSITKELYAFSRVSLFEVLSSQEELFNAGTELINGIIDRALAKYKLLHVTHKLFEQIENEYF